LNAPLGIGVITYNRREHVVKLVEAIERHTKTPFYLVIADDGSTDGTSAWARDCNIPVVTGRNLGVDWNKNRATHYLAHNTKAETFILLEDDALPCEDGWDRLWIDAARRWQHVTYANDWVFKHNPTGSGVPGNPYVTQNWVTGQVDATSRHGLEKVGYFDTRYYGYGWGHVERDWRFRWQFNQPGFLSMDRGIKSVDAGTFRNEDEVAGNRSIFEQIKNEAIYRHPYRGEVESDRLVHEQVRSTWPLAPDAWDTSKLSVICPTRRPELAHRMYASLIASNPGFPFQMVWAWNGEGSCDLPGTVVPYLEQDFRYEEAINRAVIQSTGGVLMIVNDDIVLRTEGLFQRIVNAYKHDPRLGVLHGQQPGSWSVMSDPNAPGWNGACWTIRREAFCEMGGLEETLLSYGGDEFVTRVRMKRLGWNGGRCTGWEYHHDRHSSYGENPNTHQSTYEAAMALGWHGVSKHLNQAVAGQAQSIILRAEGLARKL
jgi:GT2 family glycosyltransferase